MQENTHDHTEAEERRLRSLSPRSEPLMRKALEMARELCEGAGCHPLLVSGTRTDAENRANWIKGRVQVGPNPLDSAHWRVLDSGLVVTHAFYTDTPHRGVNGGPTGGDAVDIALLSSEDGSWLRGGARPDDRWQILGAIADELGLVWGGRFRSWSTRGKRWVPFFDGAHLQHKLWRKPELVA